MRALFLPLVVLALANAAFAAGPPVRFDRSGDTVRVLVDEKPVATYHMGDQDIPRPHFRDVFTLNGERITRPCPPDPAAYKGNDDHATFHPGIWLAFGDLGGEDFWRNKAPVRHVRFEGDFIEGDGFGSFTVVNRYERSDGGTPVCTETCTWSVRVAGDEGWLLSCDSVFRSDDADFAFGDQEEMGLGIRLDSPLTKKFGPGRLSNSEGGEDEKGTWGKQAAWCRTVGVIKERTVGAAVIPAPGNFRPSWFHSRDYGLIVANPFARKAMTAPDDDNAAPDKTVVRKGEGFRLGFGVFVFSVPKDTPLEMEKTLQRLGADRPANTPE